MKCAASGVVLALLAVAALTPIPTLSADGPRGGPRKRIAVTDVDVKIGSVLSGTPMQVTVAEPRGGSGGASSDASVFPASTPQQQAMEAPAQASAEPQQPGYAGGAAEPIPPAGDSSAAQASNSGSAPPGSASLQPTSLAGAASAVGGAVSSSLGGVAGALGFGGHSPSPTPQGDPDASSTSIRAPTPDGVPPAAAFGAGLSDMLTTALVRTDHFVVLERKDLAAMRSEQALGTDSMTNANFAAKAGKLLGAQALVRAVVTEYGMRTSASGLNSSLVPGVDVKRRSQAARVVIDVRIFDAETGQIIASEQAEGSSGTSALGVEVARREGNLGTSTFEQTPLGRAARDAIDKAVAFIVARLDAVPWKGRIAEVDSAPDGTATAVYVNAGSRVGLKEGDVLEAYALGREIVDPDTGAVIGQTGGIVGRCRVDDVNPEMSVAVPISGASFRKGAFIRFASRAAR